MFLSVVKHLLILSVCLQHLSCLTSAAKTGALFLVDIIDKLGVAQSCQSPCLYFEPLQVAEA